MRSSLTYSGYPINFSFHSGENFYTEPIADAHDLKRKLGFSQKPIQKNPLRQIIREAYPNSGGLLSLGASSRPAECHPQRPLQ